MDKKILEAAQNELATNSTKSHDKTSSKTALRIQWVSALFQKFQARYGHKWTSVIDGIETVAVAEWSEGLAGITGEQIKNGLDRWDNDWPPSLPEFVNACKGKGLNDFGLDYVPEYYREQKPERLIESDEGKAKKDKAYKRFRKELNL